MQGQNKDPTTYKIFPEVGPKRSNFQPRNINLWHISQLYNSFINLQKHSGLTNLSY